MKDGMGDLKRPHTLGPINPTRLGTRGRKVTVGICVEGVHELSSVPTVAQMSCVTCASVAVLGWVPERLHLEK